MPRSLGHIHNLPGRKKVRGRVPQGNQSFGRVNPVILVLDRCRPVRIRHDILNDFHIRERVLNEAVEISEIPGGMDLYDFLLQCAIERSWSDKLGVTC